MTRAAVFGLDGVLARRAAAVELYPAGAEPGVARLYNALADARWWLGVWSPRAQVERSVLEDWFRAEGLVTPSALVLRAEGVDVEWPALQLDWITELRQTRLGRGWKPDLAVCAGEGEARWWKALGVTALMPGGGG